MNHINLTGSYIYILSKFSLLVIISSKRALVPFKADATLISVLWAPPREPKSMGYSNRGCKNSFDEDTII